MMGPNIAPTPKMAMARPRSFMGKVSNSIAWLMGWSAPPASPCSTLKKMSEPRLGAAPQTGVVTVPVSLQVNDAPPIARNIRLYGPGDVTGIDRSPALLDMARQRLENRAELHQGAAARRVELLEQRSREDAVSSAVRFSDAVWTVIDLRPHFA